jgi:hypothetical protein
MSVGVGSLVTRVYPKEIILMAKLRDLVSFNLTCEIFGT